MIIELSNYNRVKDITIKSIGNDSHFPRCRDSKLLLADFFLCYDCDNWKYAINSTTDPETVFNWLLEHGYIEEKEDIYGIGDRIKIWMQGNNDQYCVKGYMIVNDNNDYLYLLNTNTHKVIRSQCQYSTISKDQIMDIYLSEKDVIDNQAILYKRQACKIQKVIFCIKS